MRNPALLLAMLLANLASAHQDKIPQLEVNHNYTNVSIDKTKDLKYTVTLNSNQLYKISVLQKGIDVMVELTDGGNKKILEKDSPNGTSGYEEFEYTPEKKGNYLITIKRIDEKGNPAEGKLSVYVKQVTAKDIIRRERIKKELAAENNKTVQTADIDHFWQAYDNLQHCHNYADSIKSFQELYIDRATDGLLDFISMRNLYAERYVNTIRKYPKFYASIRANTYEAKKAEPLIEEVFHKFKEVYPNFKPFKVCFAIGVANTGGTTSDKFVLIGTEVTTSTSKVDLSEFNNDAYYTTLAGEEDIVQKIKNMVAHECVHTQQAELQDSNTVDCPLLFNCMREGFCDFIGELTAGGEINHALRAYGDSHEDELWQTLKSQLCKNNAGDWLYNYTSVKDKPADLGYYIGYKIAEAYYNKAADKRQAVTDIIEMNDPLAFLQKSGYDQKDKK